MNEETGRKASVQSPSRRLFPESAIAPLLFLESYNVPCAPRSATKRTNAGSYARGYIERSLGVLVQTAGGVTWR